MCNLSKVVNMVGGQTALAHKLGVGQSHVWKWINQNGQAPAKYIKKISALTNGEVTVEALLADHENNHEQGVAT